MKKKLKESVENEREYIALTWFRFFDLVNIYDEKSRIAVLLLLRFMLRNESIEKYS